MNDSELKVYWKEIYLKKRNHEENHLAFHAVVFGIYHFWAGKTTPDIDDWGASR